MTAADVDLNLLRVLDALLEEGSVAKAAVRLHLSAPAVSRALGRLRRSVDDPLFVRSGRGLVPTPRALEMQADVRTALEQATNVLTPAPTSFDSSQLVRDFRISAGDALVAVTVQPLVDRVRQEAPGVDITFLPDTNEAELLRAGGVDLDLGAPHGLGNEIEHELLFTDPIVLALRSDHPLTGQRITARRYANADHVVVSSRGNRFGAVDRELAKLGLERSSITVVPSFVVAAHLIASSDAVAVTANAGVRAFQRQLPIAARKLPFALRPLPIAQSWHRRNTNDPAHRWLRQTVRSIVNAANHAD